MTQAILQLEESLTYINELIKDGLIEDACAEYVSLATIVQNEDNEIHRDVKANFYATFAYFLFTASLYEDSLNMFREAQQYGYSKDEIKRMIFESFIEPNLNEFKSIYEKNIQFLISNGYISRAIKFDELSFWLIPTMVKDEYYIYDKNEECIKEKFDFTIEHNNEVSLSITDEFADFLIVEEWNWNRILVYTNVVKKNNKKSYILISNMAKFLSCFQGSLVAQENMSDLVIFDGLNGMKEHFQGSSSYLPRNIINLVNINVEVQQIINEIHNYRIGKEGRKGDNILLSICIPSYNRGNRAYDNVIHNLQSYYDEEIEIVLSNNGTQNESKEYYDKISEIEDSRLKYFAFEENKGFAINLCKACEIAQGKFILLLSDEDLVDFNVLHKVMNILNYSKETLTIMRIKSDKQCFVPSIKLAEPGRDALLTYMLTSNYMSCIIFNNNLLKQHKGIEYIKENLDNSTCSYYPHMYWELLLCQYGKVKGEDLILINEGKAEVSQLAQKEIGINNKQTMPAYASLEERLKQHKGFFSIFKDLEICKKDFQIFREMYIALSGKTILLIIISINNYYKNADVDPLKILDKTYQVLVNYLDEAYSDKKDIYKDAYVQDLQQIRGFYNYYRNQI